MQVARGGKIGTDGSACLRTSEIVLPPLVWTANSTLIKNRKKKKKKSVIYQHTRIAHIAILYTYVDTIPA